MSCKCCISLRGLAYFFASTHIIVGTKFFVEFLESLFTINAQQHKLVMTETINIGTERLVYHWVFLSLGLLIFQGIDRESKTLLKRSSIIFLLLQTLTLAVRLKYGYMYSSSVPPPSNSFRDSKEDQNQDLYRGLSIGILATMAYLMILFLYVRKLESNIHGGRLFRANAPAPTHIPLNTTNLGWYSQAHTSRGSRNHANTNSTLYSPLNFFGGVMGAAGFNPLVWTNPGPPPPYTDSAPPTEPSNRSLPTTHPHTSQPCSSRTMMSMSMSTVSGNENSDKILTTNRTSDRNEAGDPSVVVPLLEEENEDKNGLEC